MTWWINLLCKLINVLSAVRQHAVFRYCQRKGICLCQLCTKLDCSKREPITACGDDMLQNYPMARNLTEILRDAQLKGTLEQSATSDDKKEN